MIFLAIGAVAGVYQLIALMASLRQAMRKPHPPAANPPPISILKPVRGWQSGFEEALDSHLSQDYPQFELLAGHRDPNDSAIPALDRAGVAHFVCPMDTPNGKVGVLAGLADHARHPILIVNDADIVVPPHYLRDVAAPLADPAVGVVTCLYRAEGDSWPSRLEALGVATEFAPNALVAPLVGVCEFGFGSTLAFRRADLDAIDGFPSLKDYLADDYQLGAKIHALGRKNLISHVVVKTRLHDQTWLQSWRHQVRWARTIRVSRFSGYAGLPVTFATFWALILVVAGYPIAAVALLAVRLAAAVVCGYFVLGSRDTLLLCWAIPLRDLLGVAVWAAGLAGTSVEWGGQTLRLDADGRIIGSCAS